MLKTPSCPWRWVPSSRSKFGNWTTVPSLYSWNIAECDVKPQPTKPNSSGYQNFKLSRHTILVGTIQTTVFALPLSIFRHKSSMMRGRILGNGVKGQFWHFVKLVGTIQAIVFVQSLSKFTCKLLAMRGGILFHLGHGVKGQLWHSCQLNLVGKILATVIAQSLSNFTSKLFMIRGGILLILGHGIKGSCQLWPPVRECQVLWSTCYQLVISCFQVMPEILLKILKHFFYLSIPIFKEWVSFYAPLRKRWGDFALHMSVGMSVSLNLVQLITQECFAQEASNLVGR